MYKLYSVLSYVINPKFGENYNVMNILCGFLDNNESPKILDDYKTS